LADVLVLGALLCSDCYFLSARFDTSCSDPTDEFLLGPDGDIEGLLDSADDTNTAQSEGEGERQVYAARAGKAPATPAQPPLRFTEFHLLAETEALKKQIERQATSGGAGGATNAGRMGKAALEEARASMPDYEEVMKISKGGKKGKGRPTSYKKRADLPKELGHHMGEANRAYVSKDWETCIELCNEVIKRAPFVPETYTTLGMVYAEQVRCLRLPIVPPFLLPRSCVCCANPP
jgi:hypothetical protein